jgi:hypothetical protein
MITWKKLTEHNDWTGEVQVRYVAQVQTADRRTRAYLQVHEVGGRYYWTANLIVPHRSDLSRIAFGTLAVTPWSLGVAKMRASRLALSVLRSCAPAERFTRAA